MTDDHFKVTKPGSGKDWMPDEALEALSLERSVQPSLSGPQLAQRLIDENVAQAAISVIHLALHSSNENTRLRACQEILNRGVGPVGGQERGAAGELEKFLSQLGALPTVEEQPTGNAGNAGAGATGHTGATATPTKNDPGSVLDALDPTKYDKGE